MIKQQLPGADVQPASVVLHHEEEMLRKRSMFNKLLQTLNLNLSNWHKMSYQSHDIRDDQDNEKQTGKQGIKEKINKLQPPLCTTTQNIEGSLSTY